MTLASSVLLCRNGQKIASKHNTKKRRHRPRLNYPEKKKEEELVKRKEKTKDKKKKKRGDSSLFKDLLVLLPFVMIRSVPPRPRKTFSLSSCFVPTRKTLDIFNWYNRQQTSIF